MKISKADVVSFVKEIISALNIVTDEVILHFVPEKQICELHEQFFQDPSFTDCITCPLDNEEGVGYRVLGEAFICPKAASGDREELARYIIHTLLHMAGYRDGTALEKQRMRRKENSLLAKLKKRV